MNCESTPTCRRDARPGHVPVEEDWSLSWTDHVHMNARCPSCRKAWRITRKPSEMRERRDESAASLREAARACCAGAIPKWPAVGSLVGCGGTDPLTCVVFY